MALAFLGAGIYLHNNLNNLASSLINITGAADNSFKIRFNDVVDFIADSISGETIISLRVCLMVN